MKTWFITGTSSGFGRIMTEQLLERGDRVVATLRHPEALDDIRERFGRDQLLIEQLDVTDSAQVQHVVDDAFSRLGRIDVIVNNAGFGLYAAIEEASLEQIKDVLDVNLMGPIDVIRAAVPHLRKQGGGRILQISSAGGQAAYPGFGYYHAAKWGIEAVCESLAAELAPFGVGVTIVEPGMTPTGFNTGKTLALHLSEYDGDTPFGRVRQSMREGSRKGPNDPEKIVAAIIASGDGQDAPLRLPLGVDTYDGLHAVYTSRLAALEAAHDVATAVGDDGADRVF